MACYRRIEYIQQLDTGVSSSTTGVHADFQRSWPHMYPNDTSGQPPMSRIFQTIAQ